VWLWLVFASFVFFVKKEKVRKASRFAPIIIQQQTPIKS
jgi:hypothetical protein